MVHVTENEIISCHVTQVISGECGKEQVLHVLPFDDLKKLYHKVSEAFLVPECSFELYYKNSNGKEIPLTNFKECKCEIMGPITKDTQKSDDFMIHCVMRPNLLNTNCTESRTEVCGTQGTEVDYFCHVDQMKDGEKKNQWLEFLPFSSKLEKLYEANIKRLGFECSFELYHKTATGKEIALEEFKNKTFEELGIFPPTKGMAYFKLYMDSVRASKNEVEEELSSDLSANQIAVNGPQNGPEKDEVLYCLVNQMKDGKNINKWVKSMHISDKLGKFYEVNEKSIGPGSSFDLFYMNAAGEKVALRESKNKTFEELGIFPTTEEMAYFMLYMDSVRASKNEIKNELLPDLSATPITNNGPQNISDKDEVLYCLVNQIKNGKTINMWVKSLHISDKLDTFFEVNGKNISTESSFELYYMNGAGEKVALKDSKHKTFEELGIFPSRKGMAYFILDMVLIPASKNEVTDELLPDLSSPIAVNGPHNVPEKDGVLYCIVYLIKDGKDMNKWLQLMHISDKLDKFYEVNEKRIGFECSFDLFHINAAGEEVPLKELRNKTFEEIGIVPSTKNASLYFTVRMNSLSAFNGLCISLEGDYLECDNKEILSDASASPTPVDGLQNLPDKDGLLLGSLASPTSLQGSQNLTPDFIPYVGLVNQAMTCYLNSLLQALYMTPEFRNALYNWEFKGTDPAKSIPYQLQSLFLNLQTSSKSAVETIELTRSFGWDSREAWQQHDIQELCRVMFDALEQTFKDTEQADLINRLYQGKMIDYVKCLECKTEKFREDTFLDIPLPVRPFRSTVAYGNVEQALKAFVQPETLDGNNQYLCDKCNKKCDAHKGLKFSKIPYLLTLHLKRFDFDYSTMHRIKLNDKVTFPSTLDLNDFVLSSEEELEIYEENNAVKCDYSRTTDSGSALDDENSHGSDTMYDTKFNVNFNEYLEDDEGIDMSSGTSNENEKNHKHNESKGPYVYELFSIMIHSGSASGGHYYAYIKDFTKKKWYCFDDQTVSKITFDDIRKTYGGGPLRSYYSGAFSSSTNAYMLMYRQIDKNRNVNAITTEEFPLHIKELLRNIREMEEFVRINREMEKDQCKLKLYLNHPTQHTMVETKLYLRNDTTLAEATEEAYRKAKLENIVPIEQCRLVSYNRLQNMIECSFDSREQEPICDIMDSLMCTFKTDFFLEIRNKDSEFLEYKPGGLNIKVFVVNMEAEDVDWPVLIRGYETQTWREFKGVLSKTLGMNEQAMKIAVESFSSRSSEPHLLERDDEELRCHASLSSSLKIYVTDAVNDDLDKSSAISKFNKIVDKFTHIVSFEIVLPVNDKCTLDSLAIPPLDLNQNCCEKADNGSGEPVRPLNMSPKLHRVSPVNNGPSSSQSIPETEDLTMGHSDQSNSEDSSLSDSDRTLVGDAPDDCLVQLSSTSNSPAASDQHLSSPEDPHSVFEENLDDENETDTTKRCCENYYFKAIEDTTEFSEHTGKILKVLVDKRANLMKLKKELEPYVGVPMEYFKIYKNYSTQEVEWTRLTETIIVVRDGEKLIVKLGRVLKENEYLVKLFQLVLNTSEPIRFLCDWVVARGETVQHAKKQILQTLKLDIPMNRCRLRKKTWRRPEIVYFDHQKFSEDIYIHTNWEMFIQELPEPEVLQNSNQVILFIRRWCPSTLELKPFEEIVLKDSSVNEFKEKLSEISDIPVENIEFALMKGTFPYEMSVLKVHGDFEWIPVSNLRHLLMNVTEEGNSFLYRDNREELKQLTNEERKEIISSEENNHVGRYGKSSMYSPRKERALKIYLDTSPKKIDDTDVD